MSRSPIFVLGIFHHRHVHEHTDPRTGQPVIVQRLNVSRLASYGAMHVFDIVVSSKCASPILSPGKEYFFPCFASVSHRTGGILFFLDDRAHIVAVGAAKAEC